MQLNVIPYSCSGFGRRVRSVVERIDQSKYRWALIKDVGVCGRDLFQGSIF